jgi:hypothetical protein
LLKYRTSTAYSRSAAANSAPPFAACLAKTNLTLTGPRPTGVRCVPSLFHDRSSWPKVPVIDTDGDENWLAEVTGRDIAFIPAKNRGSDRVGLAPAAQQFEDPFDPAAPRPARYRDRVLARQSLCSVVVETSGLRPHRAPAVGAAKRIGSASYWPACVVTSPHSSKQGALQRGDLYAEG